MAEADASPAPSSALAENIAKKGNMAYYYAHAASVSGSASPKIVSTGEAPRLLGKVEGSAAPTKPTKAPEKYSWADDTDKVFVYVTVPGVGGLPSEAIEVSHTQDSVELRITREEDVVALKLKPLSNNITAAVAKKGKDRVTLHLSKDVSSQWYDLVRK